MKKTLSLDLRERIVAAYDAKEGTREEVAKRFKVSLGMVKKLLGQRTKTGDLRPRHRFSGRKARLMPAHGAQLKQLIAREPDVTLEEMKVRLKLDCTVAAIQWVVTKLGLTYKKRLSMRPNKTAPTSSRRAGGGGADRAGSTPPGWSSSTNRRRRPI
jgi:transposase